MFPADQLTDELEQIFSRFIVTEYAYLTPKGEPLCWPVTPYWDAETKTLSIATGLAYPTKADYPKLNPKVAMLFSDSKGSGLTDPPHVVVQGDARVLDEDIQANTDRYVTELRRKFPVTRFAINPVTVKLLDFYLPRLWVEVDAVRITTSSPSGEQVIGKPVIDEMPLDKDPSGPAKELENNEWAALERLVVKMPEAVVTTVGADGYPAMRRTSVIPAARNSIELENSTGVGPACLTFHHHELAGTRFKAYMARGAIEQTDSRSFFIPRRIVGFFGNGAVFPLSVLPNVPALRRRLRKELAQRGQPMPKLRVPR